MTENVEVAGYKFLANAPIMINMHQLHHNKNEWIDHDKFIPERFDPTSEYYLTP